MRVLCTLPNASCLIGGVHFAPCEAGMVSEDIAPEDAARFASIPGYALMPEALAAPAEDAAAVGAEATPKTRRGRPPKAAQDP